VWLVPQVVSLNPEATLVAAKTSRLPDGREFDPRRMAIVEAPLKLMGADEDPNASVQVLLLTDNVMEVQTSSATEAFLVTSDVYYPGWRARIDASDAPLFPADYAFRGVLLPPGNHIVRFEYRPRRFFVGVGLSVFSLLAVGTIGIVGFFRKGTKQARAGVLVGEMQ
jgi:hypothetical protein